jgi:cytidyltransferase-like protein
MYNSRYSLFIGRYQPFHEGHKWLIQQRLNLGKNVCIAIMDIHDLEPIKNPFPTEEVKKIIDLELKSLIEEGKVKTIIIPPIDSVNYGRTVGYDIIEHTPPEKIKQISATKIRKNLKL